MPVILEPTSIIEMNLGLQVNGPVQKFFANTCYNHMDKYVPMNSGDLASISSVSADGRYIIYDVPYAQYQWRGEREDGTHKINEANRNRSKHPLATSHWDEKMATAESDDVLKEVADYARKHGGK